MICPHCGASALIVERDARGLAILCLLCAHRAECPLSVSAPIPAAVLVRIAPHRAKGPRGRKATVPPAGYVTCADVAAYVERRPQTVAGWCAEGKVAGSRRDKRGAWLIPRGWLADAVPP